MINNSFSTKTSVGGFLTIVTVVWFFPTIYFLNKDYFNKTNPEIKSNVIWPEEAIKIYNLDSNYIQ